MDNDIRRFRRAKRPAWRQKDLAQRVSMTQADIANFESGRVIPTLAKALQIAHALGQPVEAVFFGLSESAIDALGERRSPETETAAAGDSSSTPQTVDARWKTGGSVEPPPSLPLSPLPSLPLDPLS